MEMKLSETTEDTRQHQFQEQQQQQEEDKEMKLSGTTELTRQHQLQERQQQQEDKKGQEEEVQQHFHVLAVDDSLIDRKLLERFLKFSSCQVTSVDSGDKALEYLGLLDSHDNIASTATSSSSSSNTTITSTHSPRQEGGLKVNLIITDYCMPGMSGYDLLKRVKGSSWKDVPVVVMSSENIPSRINMCLEGGAEEFLLKPLQLSDVEKLQSHLLKSLDQSCKRMDNNNNNNIISKRKAMSQDGTERRPKIKGLAVA